MQGLIGRKLGMTRVFDDDGRVEPVTVIEAGPCPVLRVRTETGAAAAQLGFGVRRAKHTAKAQLGHAKRGGLEVAPAVLRELPVGAGADTPKPGDIVTVAIFQPGDVVKVIGTTKGRGFQGVVKRHGFGGGPASHGNTRYRRTGSLGPGTNPSRVIKGKRMPGRMGPRRHTVTGLRVVRVDAERNLLYVRGAVSGPAKGIVSIVKQGGRGRYA